MTPTAKNGVEQIPCQKTFFDLDTFSEVTLKKFFDFVPVSTVDEAAARLGNDAKRLIEIINDGLISEQRRKETATPTNWHLLNEEGKMEDAEFSGTPADQKMVNALVLQLSKTSIAPSMGLDWDSADKKQRDAIKEATQEFIKTTPMIRNGLKKSAALKEETVEEATA